MERPVSIVWFERCYLGNLLIGLVNTVLQWPQMMAKMAETPNADQLGPSFVPTVMIGSVLVSTALSLVLWYVTARRRQVVGKWIITIFFVIALLSVGFAVLTGAFPTGLAAVIGIAGFVLYVIAVWQLFRPDAEAWFAARPPVQGARL